MATKQQNELWNSLDKNKKYEVVILYNTRKSNKQKVEFIETLYGKSNIDSYGKF